jgi:hypothetical protein
MPEPLAAWTGATPRPTRARAERGGGGSAEPEL